MPTNLARRVVRRHLGPGAREPARGHQRRAHVVLRDVPAPSIEVIYSDGGLITAADVIRLLEPRVGFLAKLRFRPSLAGLPNTIAWEALDEKADVVSGHLVLHAAVRDNAVISWAEITIDGAGEHVVVAGNEPEMRLRQIAAQARALIDRIRSSPEVDRRDVVAGLVAIVEAADTLDDRTLVEAWSPR